MDRTKEKIYGILFGQAIGDALGLAAEGMSKDMVAATYPNGVNDYADIVQDEFRSRWPRGAWTDDTDQMLCILDSLLDKGAVDPYDIATRFLKWFRSGGHGVGRHTYNVLRMPQYEQHPYEAAEFIWRFGRGKGAPNGALMRTCVLGIWDYRNEADVRANTEHVCRLTHADPRCVGSCVLATHIIACELLGKAVCEDELIQLGSEYAPEIEEFVRLGFQPDLGKLNLDDCATKGYTLRTLAAGLWVYNFGTDFRAALQSIIAAGGDTDTNGAFAGALMGARMGYAALPETWVTGLLNKELLEERAKRLVKRFNRVYI